MSTEYLASKPEEMNNAMHTTNRVQKSSLLRPGLFQAAKHACLTTAWDISGKLVARYYERLLRQHGRTPQALAERADNKDLEFYQHLFYGIELPNQLSVLDIGCGMGDLIDFLQMRDATIGSYLGIDLVGQKLLSKTNWVTRLLVPLILKKVSRNTIDKI